MSHFFSSNLKHLRKEQKLTQEDLAIKLGLTRPKIGSYEEGRAEPNLSSLLEISSFFSVEVEEIIGSDLKTGNPREKSKSQSLKILPILVDENNNERISMVPIKAAAGYLNAYDDPNYIKSLPQFSIPDPQFSQGSFRAFQLQGDSMLPIPSGSYVLASYIENWQWIKNGACYVVLTKDQGIVYKRLQKLENTVFEFQSDNSSYPPFQLDHSSIVEIWQAKAYISFELPEQTHQTVSVDELSFAISQLQHEVKKLKTQ